MPLPVPSRPWESVSMDFVGGLPMSRKGHDYLYVVVDRFRKMCVLMPCKKQGDKREDCTYVLPECLGSFWFSHIHCI
jgi:hypothetical protein